MGFCLVGFGEVVRGFLCLFNPVLSKFGSRVLARILTTIRLSSVKDKRLTYQVGSVS